MPPSSILAELGVVIRPTASSTNHVPAAPSDDTAASLFAKYAKGERMAAPQLLLALGDRAVRFEFEHEHERERLKQAASLLSQFDLPQSMSAKSQRHKRWLKLSEFRWLYDHLKSRAGDTGVDATLRLYHPVDALQTSALLDFDRGAQFFDFEALLASVGSGAIRPLRGSFIVERHQSGAGLVRRQELPESAFWTVRDLRRLLQACLEGRGEHDGRLVFGLFIVALSYRWLTKGNPDPEMLHLARMRRMAESYLAYLKSEFFETLRLPHDLRDFAVFWDFCSIPQHAIDPASQQMIAKRSEEEEALFKAGLEASNIWYGHRCTVVVVSDVPDGFVEKTPHPYNADHDGSGWCTTEKALATLIKPGRLQIDISFLSADGRLPGEVDEWDEIMKKGRVKRPPPRRPDDFAAVLKTKKFTGKADEDAVITLYATFFEKVAQHVTVLSLHHLEWGAAEARELCGTLPSFENLSVLYLNSNPIGDEGAASVAAMLLSNASLKELRLYNCGIKEVGGAALAFAWARNRALQSLWLDNNELGDAACRALRDACGGRALSLELVKTAAAPAGDSWQQQYHAAAVPPAVPRPIVDHEASWQQQYHARGVSHEAEEVAGSAATEAEARAVAAVQQPGQKPPGPAANPGHVTIHDGGHDHEELDFRLHGPYSTTDYTPLANGRAFAGPHPLMWASMGGWPPSSLMAHAPPPGWHERPAYLSPHPHPSHAAAAPHHMGGLLPSSLLAHTPPPAWQPNGGPPQGWNERPAYVLPPPHPSHVVATPHHAPSRWQQQGNAHPMGRRRPEAELTRPPSAAGRQQHSSARRPVVPAWVGRSPARAKSAAERAF